jgi:exosortase
MKIEKLNTMALIVSILFLAAYFPIFQLLFSAWSSSDEYSHAFFTIPIIFYMAWMRRDVFLAGPPRYSLIGLPMVILSTILYLFSLQTGIFTLIALSMVLTIVSIIVYLFGIKAVAGLFTPLLLLILLIPAPIQLYAKITFPFQLKVSQASEWLISHIAIPLLREGNILHLPEKSFEVVEACSGLRSMITLATLSIIMGHFLLSKNASKIILTGASIPIAIVINILRVTTMVLLYHFFSLNLAEGTGHTVLGVLIFILGLIILFLVQRILESWETK